MNAIATQSASVSVKSAFRDIGLEELRELAAQTVDAPFAHAATALLDDGRDFAATLSALRNTGVVPMPVRYLSISPETTEAFRQILELQSSARFPRSLAQLAEAPVPTWPWVPVGQVGPLIVFGHCAPISTDFWALDPELCPRVWIPASAYLAQLERILQQPWIAKPPSVSQKTNTLRLGALRESLKAVPEDDRIVEVVRWVMTALPVAARDQPALQRCLDDGIFALPGGYNSAAGFIQEDRLILDARDLAPDVVSLARVPKSISEKYNALCFCETEAEIYMLASDVGDQELEDQLVNRLRLDKPIVWVEARANEISLLAERFEKASAGAIAPRRGPAETQSASGAQLRGDINLRDETLEHINPKNIHTPPESILQWLLYKAIVSKASDLHFEQFNEQCRVRARIDGDLVQIYLGPSEALSPMVAIIKNHSGLTMNNNDAQDGRFSVRYGQRLIDVRVSAIPWRRRFQKLTLRLLDKSASLRSLEQLGLLPNQLAVVNELLRQPQGLCVVTGPTGSGKTTMLYAALNAVSDTTINVQTIEDPIEYELEGINQTQVDDRQNLNFPTLLRRILRADPDVIMVGEIRDRETAVTAAESALTGHLVLTTLHSLDAIRSVGRMLSMGVPPYMLADSLILLHAQRLVRRMCTCRHEVPASDEQWETLKNHGIVPRSSSARPKLWDAPGCPECDGSGTRGRASVVEICAVSSAMRDLIYRGAQSEELYARAAAEGFETMYQIGLRKCLAGELSWKEVQQLRRL